MSDGVWRCGECGYSTGRSWGQVSWKCPRCNGKKDYVAGLERETKRQAKEIVRLKEHILELNEKLNPPYIGADI